MSNSNGAPQFTVNKTDLVRELSLAVGAVEKRTTIPILGNIKLVASDFGYVEITATDLEVGLQCRCAAEVKQPGESTLPAKRLLDYVRLLPDGPVAFKFADTNWATITAGRSRGRIAGLSTESFPQLPTAPDTTCELPLGVLAKLIQRTIFAVSLEESRFTLNGVLFEICTDQVRMVATDGHRLTLAEAPAQPAKAEKTLVPRKALLELLRLAGMVAGDAKIEFATDSNHLFFTVGDRVLLSRRLSGNFPDYARVLPKSFKGNASIERLPLRDALNRVRNFADERSRAVKLTLADGHLTAFGSSGEAGESEEAVPAEINGGPLTIGFNADYLLDFLGATDTERVALSFNDDKSSMQLEPGANGDGKYYCIVMPLRV